MLKAMFYVPFYREFLLASGCLSCGRNTCINTLKNGAPGRSICLLVGGAREAMDAKPMTNDFTVKNRKGFVRVALLSGARIVPTIGFGENDLLEQVNSGIVHKIQKTILETIGFFIPVFYGRGVFQYNFGLLPHRRQITVVFGEPIDCGEVFDQDQINSQEFKSKVDEIHGIYLKRLQKLYDTHKSKYELPGAKPMSFK